MSKQYKSPNFIKNAPGSKLPGAPMTNVFY